MSVSTPSDPTIDVRRQEPFGARLLGGGDARLAGLPPEQLLDLVGEHHLVVLRGFTGAATDEEFEEFAGRLGEPVAWNGSRTFYVEAHAEPEDHLFETGFMPIHWDGLYMNAGSAPDLQIFQCLRATDPAVGGATLFCDTTLVLAGADPETRALWEGLTFRYERPTAGGEVVTREVPLVVPHPRLGHPTLRFSEPVPEDVVILNPTTTTLPSPPAGHDAAQIIEGIRRALYDPRHMYAHRWQAGDVVIADNQTLLHTREPYPPGAPRKLRRVTTRLGARFS